MKTLNNKIVNIVVYYNLALFFKKSKSYLKA
jgi:hypothetical protein